MKAKLIIPTIATMLLVGCGQSRQSFKVELTEPVAEVPTQQSSPEKETEPTEPLTEVERFVKKAKPNNSDATTELYTWVAGSSSYAVQKVKKAIADGAEINSIDGAGKTPLDLANGKTANLLRKHGGKTSAELKSEGI